MKKSRFCLFLFLGLLTAKFTGDPARAGVSDSHGLFNALSSHSLNDGLLEIIELEIGEQALQLQLARLALVSKEADMEKKEWAVKQLGAQQAKGRYLIDEVQGALIDAVRLPDTPFEVKRAISRNIEFHITDRESRLEILNWALSYKRGVLKVKSFSEKAVSSAIENFSYISQDVYLKVLELATSPSANKGFRLSALKVLRDHFSQTPGDESMQSAIVDLALSDQVLQISPEAVPILSSSLSGFQDPSSGVLLQLVELAVSPKRIHRPFRKPSMDVIERNTESINGPAQKKLISELVRNKDLPSSSLGERIIRILRRIPDIDPSAKTFLIQEVFSNLKPMGKQRRLHANFYEFAGSAMGFGMAGLSAIAPYYFRFSEWEGGAAIMGIALGGLTGFITGGMTFFILGIPLMSLGHKIDKCRNSFREREYKELY